ncbi:MAG TPA: hypothetical protein PLS42_12595 [Candidatus Competibacter denitrificans]|nr:hypothetical protein [Candidatus Competibacter denitrificans]HRC70487.1 hypothetical protein [Candidatus Competibacter denitrificans]
MMDLETTNYILRLQEAILSLQKESAAHARQSVEVWRALNQQLELARTQTMYYQELQAQLNLVLLFVTTKLSTTEQFAEFVGDIVEANEVCPDPAGKNSTYMAAKGLLEAGLNRYLPTGTSSPSSPKSRPDNVVLFPARPAHPLPTLPPQPESPDPTPQED